MHENIRKHRLEIETINYSAADIGSPAGLHRASWSKINQTEAPDLDVLVYGDSSSTY